MGDPTTDVPERDSRRFDTKLVVILREELPIWQKLNATAFLVSGIAATAPEAVGEPYEDRSGGRYLPMFRQPALVFAASGGDLRRAFDRAKERGVAMAVFVDELFGTGHDEANRAAVKAVDDADLSLVGIAFRTERRVADSVTKGLRLHD